MNEQLRRIEALERPGSDHPGDFRARFATTVRASGDAGGTDDA